MQADQAQRQYLIQKVNPILEKLVIDLVMNKPEQVVDYMVRWLQTQGKKIEVQFNLSPAKKDSDGSSEGSDEEEANDEMMDKQKLIAAKKDKLGRVSVSAEVFGKFNQKGDFQPKIVSKNAEQINRIRQRLGQAFMFQALDEPELRIVINAMEEKKFKKGDSIIQQGADGDNLYVVDRGELDCYKVFKKGDEPKHLKVYQPGESFGELALLYNAPRAATIVAKEDAILFSLDRNTFNHIVKDAASKKRQQYEQFLSRVELLQDIDPYEKLQIADALKSKKYRKGDYIVREGDQGDTFYLLEVGECVATKKGDGNKAPEIVFSYKSGDYFGELALLKNAPRAASIIAQTDVSVVYLDRNSFKRLIGPIDDILRRNFKRYEKFMS